MDTPRGSDLVDFAEQWNAAGLPKAPIKPVTDSLLRAEQIGREASDSEREAQGASREVGALVAAGDLSFGEGLAELQRRLGFTEQASARSRNAIGPALRDDARGTCYRAARNYLSANASDLADRARGSVGEAYVVGWLARYTGLQVAVA